MSWNILCLPLILQELIAFSKAEHILKSNQVLIVCEASIAEETVKSNIPAFVCFTLKFSSLNLLP